MALKKLTTINNYLGLSSDEKPTGDPDGSKLYEYDDISKTITTYIVVNGKWRVSAQNLITISNANPVVDVRALDLLEQMLITLKKIEYHLSIGSDAELKDDDV